MKLHSPVPNSSHELRRLAAADLDALVAIDAAIGGRPRRAYIERRLAEGRASPELHAHFAIDAEGALAGYVLARVLKGEFGRSDPAMRLDLIGIAPAARGRGVGAALAGSLEAEARRREVGELRTSVSWRNPALLRFLAAQGWRHARELVLDRAVDEASVREDDPPCEIRTLAASDFEGIVRIDRRVTGRDRGMYLREALAEAVGSAGIRASFAAVIDGAVAGFVMARVDLGDFGRTEAVAVLDTLGIDPLHAGKGVGGALLAQLFVNLDALCAERVETMVNPRAAGLAAFFLHAGFGASERLAFEKPLA